MNARADKSFPPLLTRPRGGVDDDITAALQDRALPRPAGKIIAADPSCSPAEA